MITMSEITSYFPAVNPEAHHDVDVIAYRGALYVAPLWADDVTKWAGPFDTETTARRWRLRWSLTVAGRVILPECTVDMHDGPEWEVMRYARACALAVAPWWPCPQDVRSWLMNGDPRSEDAAHAKAWHFAAHRDTCRHDTQRWAAWAAAAATGWNARHKFAPGTPESDARFDGRRAVENARRVQQWVDDMIARVAEPVS